MHVSAFYEPVEGQRQLVGHLRRQRHELRFKFDPDFIATGLQLSPFKLPLRAGVTRGDASRFDGLMGIFDGSLPDGWGRLLIERRAQHLGLSGAHFGPLDRLSLVGHRGMGALVYEPDAGLPGATLVDLELVEREIAAARADRKRADLDQLFALGGAPQGARPKALVLLDGKGRIFPDDGSRRGRTAWMVKFRGKGDRAESAALEHAHFLMAKAAGIEVPETRLLEGKYFAIRRFDRDGARRVHQLTLAALLDVPHASPAVTYEDLLRATRRLVKDESGVTEMFRRACFNVFAQNRDAHSKNFSFQMNEHGLWRVSPAYDLSYSDGPGGEHWMLVAGEGANPGREHLVELARTSGLRRPGPIIDEVLAAVARFGSFADEASVPTRARDGVALALGGSPALAYSRTRARRQLLVPIDDSYTSPSVDLTSFTSS